MASLLDENTNQDDLIQIEEDKNYFEELVGEGKKYKDVEALAKKSLYADRTIQERERELKELREDALKWRGQAQSGMSQKDFLDQLKATLQSTSREPNPNANDDHTKTPVFNPQEHKSLIAATVKELAQAEQQERNWNEVKNKLVETYGNNYSSTLQKKLDELGLSVDQADTLARTAPKAFLNALGSARAPEAFDAPLRSEHRPSFAPNVKVRDRQFYIELRDKQPQVYYDPKTQNQMIKDAETMGADKFYARSGY